jgi:hypothetical protein
VRLHPSNRWAAEITRSGEHFWLGTFESAELAARTYDIMVWRFDGAAGLRNDFSMSRVIS